MARRQKARKAEALPHLGAPGAGVALWAFWMFASLGSPRAVLAQSAAELELRLDAPEACATSAQIYERVRSLTGSLEGSRHLRAAIRFQVSSESVHVQLKTEEDGETFERELDAPGCGEAVETTALILALALRPELGSESTGGAALASASLGPNAPPEPNASPEPNAPPEPNASPEPSTARESEARIRPGTQSEGAPEAGRTPQNSWRGVASLGVLGELGMLPTAGYGFVATAGVRRNGLSGEVYGLLEPGVRVTVEGTARGGDFSLWSVGFRGCWIQVLARTAKVQPSFEAGLCVLGEAGQLSASGVGTTTTHSIQTAWGALGVGAGFVVGLGGPWRLQLDPTLLVPLVRDSFQLEEAGQPVLVAQVGEFSGRLELKLALRF